MKHSRLIIELALALVLLGLLGWQQMTIESLRQERFRTTAAKTAGAKVSLPVDRVRRKAEAGVSGSPPSNPAGRRTASGQAQDVAALQAELTSLRQQANALAANQRQAVYSSELARADSSLNEVFAGAILSEISARPADTTGLRSDGQVAAWSGRQAIGAPDTPEAGDLVTAWASRNPDGGEEWLHLTYPKPVDISQINVHETYNPGAVSRIAALLPDGSEKTLWEGTEPREEAPVEVGFPVPAGVRSDQIKVYLDTARVPGWNEIDAVELVGKDGSRQWATTSSASSYYGDRR
jgi:hypothetical protein